MPFGISWGRGVGVVTVIVETAREALSLAADYEAQGCSEITVKALGGAELSMIELKALAAMGPDSRSETRA